MICPRCGSEVSAASTRCARCAAPVGVTVATGLLTPPPPTGTDESATSLITDESATSLTGGGVDVDADDRTINISNTPPPGSGDADTAIPGTVTAPSDEGP